MSLFAKLRFWLWIFFWAVAFWTAYQGAEIWINHKSLHAELNAYIDEVLIWKDRPGEPDFYGAQGVELRRKILELCFARGFDVAKDAIKVEYTFGAYRLDLDFPYQAELRWHTWRYPIHLRYQASRTRPSPHTL